MKHLTLCFPLRRRCNLVHFARVAIVHECNLSLLFLNSSLAPHFLIRPSPCPSSVLSSSSVSSLPSPSLLASVAALDPRLLSPWLFSNVNWIAVRNPWSLLTACNHSQLRSAFLSIKPRFSWLPAHLSSSPTLTPFCSRLRFPSPALATRCSGALPVMPSHPRGSLYVVSVSPSEMLRLQPASAMLVSDSDSRSTYVPWCRSISSTVTSPIVSIW